MSRNSQSIGIFWAGVSVLCWGTLFPAASFLLKRGHVDCYSMSQIRFLVAGLTMLIVLAGMERRFPWDGLRKTDWIQIILYSVFAGGMSYKNVIQAAFCHEHRNKKGTFLGNHGRGDGCL